nr:hypothetical protein [Nocardia wallacei]
MLSKHCPYEFREENWLFEDRRLWLNMGRVGWLEACSLAQDPDTLWLNGYHSDRGVNNCVPVTLKTEVRGSLKLIHVNEADVTVSPRLDGKRRVRLTFQHNKVEYMLPVTDPEFLKKWQVDQERENKQRKFSLGESLLTVSLAGEATHNRGNLHKLVAGVVERSNEETVTT